MRKEYKSLILTIIMDEEGKKAIANMIKAGIHILILLTVINLMMNILVKRVKKGIEPFRDEIIQKIQTLPKEQRKLAQEMTDELAQKITAGKLDLKTLQKAGKYVEEINLNLGLAKKNAEINPKKSLDFIINANGALNELKKIGLIDTKSLETDLLETRIRLQKYIETLKIK